MKNAQAKAQAVTQSDAGTIVSIAFVALLGATLLFVAGFANSQTMHDAAHDTRHAAGFPCH